MDDTIIQKAASDIIEQGVYIKTSEGMVKNTFSEGFENYIVQRIRQFMLQAVASVREEVHAEIAKFKAEIAAEETDLHTRVDVLLANVRSKITNIL